MLIDMLVSAGQGSKEAFIWWLLADKVFPGLVWLITLTVLAHLIWRLIARMTGISMDSFRVQLGIRDFDAICDNYKETRKAIHDLISQRNK